MIDLPHIIPIKVRRIPSSSLRWSRDRHRVHVIAIDRVVNGKSIVECPVADEILRLVVRCDDFASIGSTESEWKIQALGTEIHGVVCGDIVVLCQGLGDEEDAQKVQRLHLHFQLN